MNREPINPLCLITKLVSLIEISCFSKRATPFCPIPARRLGLFLSLSPPPPEPFNRGIFITKVRGRDTSSWRAISSPTVPSFSVSLVASREIHPRIYASRFVPRDPFSSSPRPNRFVTSPSSRLRVFQRNARMDVYKGGRGIVVDR